MKDSSLAKEDKDLTEGMSSVQRSLLLKRVSGSVRGNNQRKSDVGRGRNRSQFQGCNIKNTTRNMTKIVI